MIFYFVVMLLYGCALVTQMYLPPLEWMHGAQVMLAPILFFYAAAAFPYPFVLLFAFVAGLSWDLLTLQPGPLGFEIRPGTSILVYSLFATLMHGMRPLFIKGRWEVHCLFGGLLTAGLVMVEFGMLGYARQSLVPMGQEVAWRVLGPGAVAVLLAPPVYLALNFLGRLTGYRFGRATTEGF